MDNNYIDCPSGAVDGNCAGNHDAVSSWYSGHNNAVKEKLE
jgi:hypothetical protein